MVNVGLMDEDTRSLIVDRHNVKSFRRKLNRHGTAAWAHHVETHGDTLAQIAAASKVLGKKPKEQGGDIVLKEERGVQQVIDPETGEKKLRTLNEMQSRSFKIKETPRPEDLDDGHTPARQPDQAPGNGHPKRARPRSNGGGVNGAWVPILT